MPNLVSIIIPAYNAERFILQTVNSALNQTYQNIEIVIVNDGSTDATLSLLESLKNDKIKIINQANRGASFAKQVGLDNANGDFIQYLDADDLLSENKIEIQIEALLDHPNKIAVCSTVHFNDTDDFSLNKPSPYEERFLFSTDQPDHFLINLYGGYDGNGSMIQPNAFLTPISIIKKIGIWNSEISPCADEDGEYFCRAILASEGVVYTPHALNYYRKFIKKGSLSALKDFNSLSRLYKSVLLKKNHLLSINNSKEAKFATAKQLISLAIEIYPQHLNLVKEINNEVKKLGNFKYTPISGGPMAQRLSKIIGWRAARFIQFKLKKK